MRRLVPLALVLVLACGEDAIGPAKTPGVAIAPELDAGPPSPHAFGPDQYAIGAFTGQGSQEPGLHCTTANSGPETCTGYLASAVDGTLLDVTLQIPTNVARPVPLVALVHGYAGSKSSSGDVARALLDEGYAVLRWSTRGFGESWGQVNLVDVHAEVADMRSMIAQAVDLAVDADGSDELRPDAVAVTGASYGGGHSWLAALQPTFTTPRGQAVTIRTVVPIAAWSDLLYSLLPNGEERWSLAPLGAPKLSYINGLYLSGADPTHKQGAPGYPLGYPNYPAYFMGWHAWIDAMEPNNVDPQYRAIADGLAGYRSIWWQDQFWSQLAASRVPVFMVQGFTDDLFPLPEAKRMLLALQTVDPSYPVTAYFGDIGHPRASNKQGEVDYVLGLIKQWLAAYLKGSGTPPTGVYAAFTRPRAEPFDAGNVITVPTLDALATGTVSKRFPGAGVLVNPVDDPLPGVLFDPFVGEGEQMLPPATGDVLQSPLLPGSLLTFDVPVTELSGGGALTIAGQPTLSLHAATSAYRVQLDVRLLDVDAAGVKRLITRGTYTLESGTVGQPIGGTSVTIPTYGNLWRAEAGHTLRVELSNVDSPYITPSRVPSATTVNQVTLTVPVR